MNIKKEFEKNRDNFIADLQGLIRIPSVAAEADGEYPFGKEVQRALDYMLELGKSMGFEVKNVDNYGGHIDFPGAEEGIMAIVGHVDVVPEGDGWTQDPFGGAVLDGWLYGRGAQDDKGPAMAGLYAMKVLKDLGFKPKKTVRLILGLDEEANWEGMKHYLGKEKAPDFGIVPDADFPLVQCEKGLLEFDLVRKNTNRAPREGNDMLTLEIMSGGSAPNVVAGHAHLIISGNEKAQNDFLVRIKAFSEQRGYELISSDLGGRHLVSLEGIPAHAAVPERGRNAISMAMDLIQSVVFANDDANSLVKFYNDKIGFSLDGSRIGCAMEDELSGRLTLNVGKISFDSDQARITIDIRYPVTKTKEQVCKGLETAIKDSDFEMEILDHIGSIYQESDNPVVETLVKVYRKISGDMDTKPSAIGGATFARAIPNCMAFGALFPGDPELEHQKDEKIEISQLLKAGHIYAEAVYQLTK